MINNEISKKVLTIGCNYKKTKGGISTVIGSYSQIYKPFNFLSTSNCNGLINNIIVLFFAITSFCIKCIKNDIKIVHIHAASNNSFLRKRIFINIAHFFKKKVVLHIHGGGFKEYTKKNNKIVSSTISKVDAIIALSDYWEKYFNETYPNKKVITIKNIVEEPKTTIKVKNSDVTTAVFIGLICDNKGVFDLVETINENKEYLEGKFKLYIAGNGETNRLCDYIEKYNLNNIIEFKGWVDYNQKAELLSNSDVFILPSYIEGVPISILEAMTYKLPIIASNIGGIPEIVVNGENGYLHTPGDKLQLLNYINKTINDKELSLKMGINSYSKVQPHLPENVAQSLERMYKIL